MAVAGERFACAPGVRLGLVVLASVVVGACTSGSSSVTSPSLSEKCGVSASASLQSVPASGGEGTIAIQSERDCIWTLTSDAVWITVAGPTQGQGTATVPYRVAANGTPVGRRGSMSVGAVRLDIAQQGAPCHFDIDRTQIDVPAQGGTATVRITAMSGCTWTAHSQEPWTAIATGAAGAGTGEVALTIARNAGAARQGAVVAAGHTVIVRQSAGETPSPTPPAPAPPTPSPPRPPAPSPPPPPPPSPPPPSPTPSPVGRIDLDGRLANLRGSCPMITFVLEGYTVYSDQSTEFRRGNCSHLAERGSVEVRGQRYSDGRVYAERITIEDRRD